MSALCTCPEPSRPTGREPEQLPPWECRTCGGYACEYAHGSQKKCPTSICFIDQYPDSPRDLHPEAFVVTWPTTVTTPGASDDSGSRSP